MRHLSDLRARRSRDRRAGNECILRVTSNDSPGSRDRCQRGKRPASDWTESIAPRTVLSLNPAAPRLESSELRDGLRVFTIRRSGIGRNLFDQSIANRSVATEKSDCIESVSGVKRIADFEERELSKIRIISVKHVDSVLAQDRGEVRIRDEVAARRNRLCDFLE